MLSLSSKAVTNMINGLFVSKYDPPNTTIDYHWTEHQSDETLKTTLADTNPCIIFLGDVSSKVPSEYKLKLDFGDKNLTFTQSQPSNLPI